VGANLSVTTATVTVTADAKSKVYGAGLPALTFTTSALVNGDTIASAFSGALATTATASSSVASYPITQGTLTSTNYAITFVGANLSVTTATVTVTADAKSKVYGAGLPALTFTTSALVNGDSLATAFSGALTTTATASSSVASYPITQGNLSATNYAITYVGANLIVTTATVTVTADAKTKVYGAGLPALTFTTSALVNGDTIASAFSGVLATTATASSGVASYPITQGNLSATNYKITFVGANLQVTPANLAITADNKTKIQGTANPTLTFTPSGFVNGDTLSALTNLPILATTAGISSPVSDYPITVSGATAANYSISYINGILHVVAQQNTTTTTLSTSVNPAVTSQPIVLTATVAKTSGAALPTGTVSFKEGTTVLGTAPVSAGTATLIISSLSVGTHSIVAVYGGDTKYTGSTSKPLGQVVQTVALESDPLDPTKRALFVGGTPGNDLILIQPASKKGFLQVSETESNLSQFQYNGSTDASTAIRLVVFGGPGNDLISVSDDIKLATILDGGAGNDVLKGGKGMNILLGQEGNDVLSGNSMRELLIGGVGQDLLTAGAGQDILIGGTTDFDQNLTALAAIMQEWSRTDLAYDGRVAHLLSGGGKNGSNRLSTASVHDDGAANLLLGGSDLDLYFAGLADVILGQNKKDKVVKL
jgi:Ca2+-binding RTX toxin-like protein